MRRHDRRAITKWMAGIAGVAALGLGTGMSVNATETIQEPTATSEATCGSIDPGFAYMPEETIRGRNGSIDPGFAPDPDDPSVSEAGGSIDPGFARPIENCPVGRLQDVLASPAAELFSEELTPFVTPWSER